MSNLLVMVAANNRRVGKNAFADLVMHYLREAGIECKEFNFATGVKKEVARIKNVDVAEMYDDTKKELHRQDMIDVGDGYRIQKDALIWAKEVKAELSNYFNEKDRAVAFVTDVRYPNEPQYLNYYFKNKTCNTLSVFVHANPATMKKRLSPTDYAAWLELLFNSSQRQISPDTYDFDEIISNNGTLYELDCKAQAISKIILDKFKM